MGQFLVVAKRDRIDEYLEIAKEYGVGFEFNDFFIPDFLDDGAALDSAICRYSQVDIPLYNTMHGVFLDVIPFSSDAKIREVSRQRMDESMKIASQLGVRGVVFHTNCYPILSSPAYDNNVIERTVEYLKVLLNRYPRINIYLENMFDADPSIMEQIGKALVEYKNFGLCLDYAHASISPTSIDDWVKALEPYVKHLHINDNDLNKDLHQPVGSGQIDWIKFKKYYDAYFKHCSILIETNAPEDQRRSLDYIKNVLNISLEGDDNMANRRPYTADELLERIFYYVSELADVKGFESTIETLTGLGRDMVNSERASFWYWDKRKKQIWTLAAHGRGQIVVPEDKGIIGATIQNNEIILINSPYEDSRFNPAVDKETGFVTKSILSIPVTNTQGQVIGAYQAINKLDEDGESNFDEQDIKRLSMAAMFCGKTLESLILYQDAHMDQLTGLKNRRGFHEFYSESIKPVLENEFASIIMCDIDHFKRVNDTYGHNAGDAVLVHVAERLQKSVEGIGEVVRWGGEEFIMLLPKKTLEEAIDHAETLRKAIEASVCVFEGTEIKVTMSFGVKMLDATLSADMNVELVDENLYKAKEGGRNRVIHS